MDAATIAAGLERSKQTSQGEWTACCPAHEDRTPSLSISDSEKGVLVHCHAGCSQQHVIDALKSKNLWSATKKPAGNKPRSKIAATYDYINEHGELVFQVVRFDPKDFRQRQPVNGSGGWQWNLKGVSRIPYHLPEVIAAERGICIVEGEKDADNLSKLGITATTCPGGAEKWQASYNKWFKDKSVFIIPDNDEPGRKHAQSVAQQITGIAKTVKVIELPDLTAKQDISDWLNKGNSKAQLAELIKSAPAWNPESVPEPVAEPSKPVIKDDWRAQLMLKDDGAVIPNVNNAQLLLHYHDNMVGVLGYNQFTKSIDILRQPPWEPEPNKYPRPLTDVDDIRATAWLETKGCKLSITVVHGAIVSAAHHNPFHPLQDHLNNLKWDGQERLTTALCRYFGCESDEYSQAVSRRFLIGAVARALDPGCKMDTMLILEGTQGLKKSTAVAELFYDDWFSDELADMGSKDAAMQIQGIWCIELAELATMYRAESNRLKEWLTRREDRFRPPYGRNIVQAPRQCVLVGTVNPEGGYLKDATGGRRFWPISCTKADISTIKSERDQLWAEAVAAYKNGERWWFDSDEYHLAEKHQEERYESDPWEEQISEWLLGRNTVSIMEIMDNCLDIQKGQQSQLYQTRIAKVLVADGWRRVQRRINSKRRWVYVRNGDDFTKNW